MVNEKIKIEKYKKILDDLQQKISECYKNRKINMCSYIRLGLLAKYDKSIKAIYQLDSKGFFEDANIILRTVFEIFITIMYCEIKPEEYYTRFFDYNSIIRLKNCNGDDEISQILQIINKKEIENLKIKKQEFIKKYKVKNSFKWNDMDVQRICNELDKHYDVTFCSYMYRAIYRESSGFIHPNIVNIFENYIAIENKNIKLNLKNEADNEKLEIVNNLENINKVLLKVLK